jgi:hypothetical protein
MVQVYILYRNHETFIKKALISTSLRLNICYTALTWYMVFSGIDLKVELQKSKLLSLGMFVLNNIVNNIHRSTVVNDPGYDLTLAH